VPTLQTKKGLYGAVSVSVFLFLPETLPELFAVTRALANGLVELPRLEAGQHPGQDWNWDGRQGSIRDAIDAAAIAW